MPAREPVLQQKVPLSQPSTSPPSLPRCPRRRHWGHIGEREVCLHLSTPPHFD